VMPGTGFPLPSTKARLTVPVKPFLGVMVRVVVPLDPCWTVRLVGLREMVKLGVAPPLPLPLLVIPPPPPLPVCPPQAARRRASPRPSNKSNPLAFITASLLALGILHSQVRGTQTAPENPTLPRKTPYSRP
jgi:hypothetical protein